MKWIFIIVSFLFCSMSIASGDLEVDSAEQELIQKARKRLYPGGYDEQDLEVQAVLIKPQRKRTYLDAAESEENSTPEEGM
jgi:hypothetical protein